jgi:hypothetical protein
MGLSHYIPSMEGILTVMYSIATNKEDGAKKVYLLVTKNLNFLLHASKNTKIKIPYTKK